MMRKVKLAIENPELIIPYIRRRVFGQLLPPREIMIGVNDVCNARCKMCNLPIKQRLQEFDIETFKKVINEVKSFKPKISFKLTEPSLKRDIIKFVQICTDNGLETALTTNGFLLPTIAEKLVEAGLKNIQVSIGGLEEKHDSIRRLNGCFKNAVDGIKKLVYYRKEYGSNLKIIIDFAICPDNYMDLYETYNSFKGDDIDLFKFPHMNFDPEEIPLKMDIDVLYNQIQKVKGDGKIKYKFLPEISKKEMYDYYNKKGFLKGFERCFVPYTHCYIDFNYDVRPNARCIDIVFGNIKKQPLMEIWRGEKYNKFRETLKKHPFDYCQRCCGVTTAPKYL